jgi:uncharacterized Ntn-hydrolase superfamily protein
VIVVEAGVGALVSQAMGERAFAYQGLEMMRTGSTPSDAIAGLVAHDTMPEVRQFGAIDATSPPAAFTGTKCVPHAEHQAAMNCAAQANMMTNPGVPQAMVAAFEASDGDLATRLLAALDAAQALGGDFRGMQSAGLVVRAGERATPVWSASVVDARVDDHAEPLRELRRLVELADVYRQFNATLTLLAAGDHQGAVDAARELCRAIPTDLNAQMRLGLVLLAAGDAEGRTILGDLAARNERWLVYARRSLERHGLDPTPILGQPG